MRAHLANLLSILSLLSGGMRWKCLVLILITVFRTDYADDAFGCQDMGADPWGKGILISAATGNGKECEVIGFRPDLKTYFRYKCDRIQKGGIPISTKSTTSNLLEYLTGKEELTLIDIYPDEKSDDTSTTAAIVWNSNKNEKERLQHRSGTWTLLKELNGNQIMAHEIFSDYKLTGYSNNSLIVDTGKKTSETIINEEINAIIFLGYNEKKQPLIGVVHERPSMTIFEMENMKLIPVDSRFVHPLIGCPQNLCLEGSVDSVFSLPIDGTVYMTRNNYLFELKEIGSKQLVAWRSDSKENKHDCDAHFVVRSGHKYSIFCIQEYRDTILRMTPSATGWIVSTYTRRISIYFKEIAANEYLFAAMRFQLNNQDNYYFFAGENIYHYINPDAKSNEYFVLEFVKKIRTKDRFFRIWNNFDAIFKDPASSSVYVFNRDFNVEYEWQVNEDVVLEPDFLTPKLNSKTFWTCDLSEHQDKFDMLSQLTPDTLDYFLSKTAYQYRFVELPKDEEASPPTTANATSTDPKFKTTRPSKLKSQLVWIIPVGIILGLICILIITYIIGIVIMRKPGKKKKKKKDKKNKKKRAEIKPAPSFASLA